MTYAREEFIKKQKLQLIPWMYYDCRDSIFYSMPEDVCRVICQYI
jgi:hypothetical protein